MKVPNLIVEPHYTLRQAAEKFFPNGPLTAASLRNEIKKGRLQATMPAGKLMITERALVEMLERCRVHPDRHDCISNVPSAAAKPYGASERERIERARASIRATGQVLKKPSLGTSTKNTLRRKA
jgi:hypothetical protein